MSAESLPKDIKATAPTGKEWIIAIVKSGQLYRFQQKFIGRIAPEQPRIPDYGLRVNQVLRCKQAEHR
jgi:hypothetical protein